MVALDGRVQSYEIPTPDSLPTGIVAGADGALWFTERDTGRIGRITTDGRITEFSAGLHGTEPSAITLGADGNVWFTEESGWVGRITPDGTIRDWQLPTGADPQGIALGEDDHLWLTDLGRHAIDKVSSGPGVDVVADVVAGPDTTTLRGSVSPAGQQTSYQFEYGTSTSYGSKTPLADAGAGTGTVSATATIGGLSPGTTYHYRLVATNVTESTAGPDRTFTTSATPENPLTPPTLDQVPNTRAVPPVPVLGRSVVVGASQGVVKVRLAGTNTFVPLTSDVSVPTGSEIDTTKGSVTLVSALDTRGHSQAGMFSGGRFKVKQSKTGKGMTDLYLSGPKPGRCSAPNRASASKVAKKRKRSLWGKDNKGRFRTHGADSVATVRGTRWLTEDRCDGTLTRVTQGSVVVKDLRRKRTKVVRAGQSYLARRK
jgi:hypothetical protein